MYVANELGAVMCVSEELLCSFELLKPLDASALKQHMKKGPKYVNSPPAKYLSRSE